MDLIFFHLRDFVGQIEAFTFQNSSKVQIFFTLIDLPSWGDV